MRKKLTLYFSFSFGIPLGLCIYLLTVNMIRNAEGDFTERTTFFSEHIKNGMVALMLEGKGRDFQQFIDSELIGDVKSIRLLRDDGFIIGSSSPGEVGSYIPSERFENMKAQIWQDRSIRFKLLDDRTYEGGVRAVIIPLWNDMPCQKCHSGGERIRAILAVEISASRYLQILSKIKMEAILYFLVILTVSTLVMWFFAGIVIEKPLNNMLKSIRRMRRDLMERIYMVRDDELGEIAKGINEIMSELEKTKKDFETCHLAEIRRVEQMATLGELASAVAHEIRNPLAGISGAIQVLSEEFSDADPRQPIIKEILKEVERLDRSVKDLLMFARTPEPSKRNISIQFLIDRLMRFIDPQAKKNGVSVQTSIAPGIDEIYVDPEQIHQAFYNIAHTSIQNMPGGGTLTITIRKEKDECIISFSDTGQGIPQDEIKLLFKPFYARHSGIGSLGLTISRGIIERHGGSVEVESIVGRGTTFTVRLPAG